jgi:hypothetical protein
MFTDIFWYSNMLYIYFIDEYESYVFEATSEIGSAADQPFRLNSCCLFV